MLGCSVAAAHNPSLIAGRAYGRAVACFLLAGCIGLDEHWVINVRTERALDCFQVNPQAVRRKLNPVDETARKIVDEHQGALRVPVTGHKRRDQLCVCVDCYQCPNIIVAEFPLLIVGHILLFGVNKLPNLINLNLLALKSAKRAVLVVCTRNAHNPEEFQIVTFETPVMRTVELIEFPSTLAAMIWACLVRLSLFMSIPTEKNSTIQSTIVTNTN